MTGTIGWIEGLGSHIPKQGLEMADEPEVLTKTEARGGVTPHIVRYVLIISTILAVIAMVWVFAAAPDATQPDTAASMSTR